MYDVDPPEPATWQTPPHCGPGALALADAVKLTWPSLFVNQGAYGCYNRRPTDSGGKSVHGDGRALDFGIGWDATPEDIATLDRCVHTLGECAQLIGVCRMLWNYSTWKLAGGWRHTGTSGGAHTDHAHVEITHEAAWSRPVTTHQALQAFGPQEDRMAPIYVTTQAGAVYALDPYTGHLRQVSGPEWYDLLNEAPPGGVHQLADNQIEAIKAAEHG